MNTEFDLSDQHTEYTDEEKMHFKILGKRCGGTYQCWRIIPQEDGNEIAIGYVFGDDSWYTGTSVMSSSIQYYGPDKSYIVTQNTVYKLGKPEEDYTEAQKFGYVTAARTDGRAYR